MRESDDDDNKYLKIGSHEELCESFESVIRGAARRLRLSSVSTRFGVFLGFNRFDDLPQLLSVDGVVFVV